MPANPNQKRQACVVRIMELNKQLQQMRSKHSMEYDAACAVKCACDDIVRSLDSIQKYSISGLAFKQSGRTDDKTYQQVMDVLDLLNPTLEFFNTSMDSRTPEKQHDYNENIPKLANLASTLSGQKNLKLSALGFLVAGVCATILIVGFLGLMPLTFGVSAIPAAIVATMFYATVASTVAMCGAGVYFGVKNFSDTDFGLAKSVSDLTALDSMKPPRP